MNSLNLDSKKLSPEITMQLRSLYVFLILCIINYSAFAQGKNNSISGNRNSEDPQLFLNERFSAVTVKSAIKFCDVMDYKGKTIPLKLDIYRAAEDTTSFRPVIMWVHGGGFRTGSSRTQNYIVRLSTDFAKRGFVCISIDYRLRDGSDMPDKRSEAPALQDAATDANTALDWIRANAVRLKIDAGLIFVGGGSAGGRISTTLSMFPGSGKTIWNKKGIIANASLWGGPEPELRDWIYPYLKKTSIPTILIHGDADVTINVQNSIDLYNALQKEGASSELHVIPGAAHTPVDKTNYQKISGWVAAFFVKEWIKTGS